MNDIINTIDEFEAVRAQQSSRTFEVNIPDELGMKIVESYPEHREAIASNKTISESIIRLLAVDEDPRVRGRIADKRATPADVQIALAQDPSHSVRAAIGRNPKVPREALEILLQDPVDWIAEEAQEQIAELDSAGK